MTACAVKRVAAFGKHPPAGDQSRGMALSLAMGAETYLILTL